MVAWKKLIASPTAGKIDSGGLDEQCLMMSDGTGTSRVWQVGKIDLPKAVKAISGSGWQTQALNYRRRGPISLQEIGRHV